MLLESLVKATMELQGFRVMAVTGDAGGLVAELVPDLRFSPRCGQCGAPGRYRDTRGTRRFRHVPLWGIAVALRYAPRRVRCARCAGVHVESLPWVSGKQQMTRALMVVLATWARTLPWQQVARLFRCSWGTVATAVEEAVAYGLAQQDLADLTHIGIDEISRKRGHVYVTNVYDLARKRLVWSGPGRTQDTLHAFFDFLGPERTAALEGICCDMWQPYIDVIHVRAGQAVLVFDKFHIVSHLTTAVDQVRRDEIREKGPAQQVLMHKTRFIWLKNPWNLTERPHRRLSELQRLNFTTLRQVNQLTEAGEGEPELGFMARLLALCSLPRTNPKQRVQYIRRNGPYKLIMQAGGDPARLPFGNLPRLLLAWVCTEAVRTQHRELVLGRSLYEFMQRLGMEDRSGGLHGERTRLKNQMTRLFSCSVQLIYADTSHRVQVQSFIADRAEFWWDVKRPAAPVLWDSTIRIGEEFFNEIIAHPIPFDLHTLRALKRSSLGLDLYFWLVYRTFALKRPLCLSWKQLYSQFGADPAKSSENTTVQHFRKDCIRELKKISRAWPDLHYETVTGGFVVSPSPPRIPPAQLRLISE